MNDDAGLTQTIAPTPEPARVWRPERGPVGMACLIAAESAIFIIFVVAYLFYRGKDLSGPTPRQVLSLPVLGTVCLLFSSFTIATAVRALRRGVIPGFVLWWAITICLGAFFIVGTLMEWRRLIIEHGLTIHTNLFGSTFYALVGLHASHVVVGLLLLAGILALTLAGGVRKEHADRIHVVGLYWHFVDVVWIVVLSVVYLT